MSDPDHVPGHQIEKLYRHWLDRQRKGLRPLVILNPGPLHLTSQKKISKGKGKARNLPYVEVSTDNSEGGGDDGGSDDEQAEGGDGGFDKGDRSSENLQESPKRGPPIGKRKIQQVTYSEPGPSSRPLEAGKKKVFFGPKKSIDILRFFFGEILLKGGCRKGPKKEE